MHINPFTAILSLENDPKNAKSYTLESFCFFFALACENFINPLSIESRCFVGPENILFASASVHLSARKFEWLRQ